MPVLADNKNQATGSHQKTLNQKNFKISLRLHTMPQSDDSHFKKWLFLALSAFILMAILVILIFWE